MRISSTTTSSSAAPSSVPLMFSKTLIASAAKPAGPVTLTSSPPPGSLTRSRMSSIGSRIVVAVAVAGDVADQQRGVAGLRRRAARRTATPRGRCRRWFSSIAALSSVAVGRDPRLVGVGQPALAAVDDHDRRLLAALQLLGDRRAPRSTRRRRAGSSSTRCSRRRCTCRAGSRRRTAKNASRQTASTTHFAVRPAGTVRKRVTRERLGECGTVAAVLPEMRCLADAAQRLASPFRQSSAASSSGSVTGRRQAKRSHT